MRRGGYVAAVVACAAVAAGALAGCEGDGGDPTPSPSQSASSSAPPPSPSESTSASPQAETAEEFIRRWVEVRNEMQNTGDTKEYRRLSRGCGPCLDVADRVDVVYQAGGFIRTDGWSVLSVKKVRNQPRVATYHVRVDNAPTEYKESSGGALKSIEPGRPTLEVTIRGTRAFRVVELAQVPD